jgi:hypothetical protein
MAKKHSSGCAEEKVVEVTGAFFLSEARSKERLRE